jgi:hypothetical protein
MQAFIMGGEHMLHWHSLQELPPDGRMTEPWVQACLLPQHGDLATLVTAPPCPFSLLYTPKKADL